MLQYQVTVMVSEGVIEVLELVNIQQRNPQFLLLVETTPRVIIEVLFEEGRPMAPDRA